MSERIAIAVLNWNGRKLLETYLPDVVKHSNPHPIYVIDNNSTDDSLTYIADYFPDVITVQTGENLGYAGGYNKGLESIDEEVIVLLNSDVRTTPDWLVPIANHLEKHPNCGALQPKILWDRDPSKFEYAGAAGGFMDILGYPFCRGRLIDHLEADLGQYNEPTPVFWATGACLVVRKSAFERAGKFDELLFAHMEEIDLCWRMQRAGYEIWSVPSSTVYHLGGATLESSNPKKTFLNFRNNLHIIVKNLPPIQAMKIVGVRLILDGFAGLKFLIDRKPAHTWAIVRAHFSFYSRFTRIQRERLRLIHTLHLPVLPWAQLTGIYTGSMAYQFYVKRKVTFTQVFENSNR